jgi:hypothetical protein
MAHTRDDPLVDHAEAEDVDHYVEHNQVGPKPNRLAK